MRSVCCAAALAVVGLASAASAGENLVHVMPATTSSTSAPVVNVSQSTMVYRTGTVSQGGFFNRVMDLERRKNAWLRRTFLR